MKKTLGIAVGVLMIVFGAVFTAQGLDLMKGSAMSGQTMWAILGPIIAALGVALIITVVSASRRSRG